MSIMHPIDPSNPNSLGRDLRALRKSRGLTLSQLAKGSNRSVGFISQVERGISDPSIKDLRTLAKVLDVPVSLLFMSETPDPVERDFIVRKGARRSLGTKIDGIVEELLSPDLGGSFEMFRSVIEPFTEQSEPVLRQTEEAGYIVQGQIDLWINEQKFSLKTGDSFRFDHQPCRWHNRGDIQAIIIWVVSPPVY
ncbi:MAG: XRE family transcriptional regulator [Rhodobacteraceae bacterium]|nr:XRE family transcriptional regulator [Paracoccaceae bacterium]